ncbi:MAG TPA: M57 family metalloprotease [Thermoanaerobaculia bacterium]
MRITSPLVRGLAALLFLATPLSAEYFVVPTDVELIMKADVVAIVEVTGIHGSFAGDYDIVTNIDVEPELVLKGEVDRTEPLRIVEPGGEVGSQLKIVSAAPRYWVGNRALVFLTREGDGWRTWGASLGKFDFVRDGSGRELAVRWATPGHEASLWRPDGQPHFEQRRDAALFLAYIRQLVNDRSREDQTPARRVIGSNAEVSEAEYVVAESNEPLTVPFAWDPAADAVYPPSAYTHGNFRWIAFDSGQTVTFNTNGVQPGYDSIGAAQRGLAAWTNDSGSNVRYVYGTDTDDPFKGDRKNTIVYNQSTGVPEGAIAYAQWFGDDDATQPPVDKHVYEGETFVTIVEGDVIVRSNLSVSQKVFDEAITHELGHTLGLRHSDQGTPESTQAVMRSVLTGLYGATLGPWDIEAVRTVYKGTTGPAVGTPANLVATANSSTTIAVTWSAAANATSYRLERSVNNGAFALVATVSTTSYTDTGRAPNTTYLYRVQAVGASGTTPSAFSNVDHATTVAFTDASIVPGMTIRAVHLTELRTAVNAVRASVGLAPAAWTDANPAGVRVKAVHIRELRNALSPALTELGRTATFTDPGLDAGDVVKAIHFQEIRNLVR